MELKHINSYDEIVPTRKLNHLELSFLENKKIEFKNESNTQFSLEVAMIAGKSRCSITFISLIQMK